MDGHRLDRTGKVELRGIYDNADPCRYFSTLSRLDYRIPGEAKPFFRRVVAARREASERRDAKLIDIGCSYGVNGALLKHGLSMGDLYALYGQAHACDRDALLARDRALYAEPADGDLEIVGVDVAANAIEYAVEAGAMDAGVAADFERHDPGPAELAALAGSDLMISTGCFGYVTDASLERILEATGPARPWMAHFVLRMFPFDEAEARLARHGYVTEKLDGLFAQRRFASAQERESVLANLDRLGIDPAGAEAAGWYFAELHLVRPESDARALPAERLFAGLTPPRLPH